MPEYERLHIQLIEKTSAALRRTAETEGLSKTDVVNRAIQLYAFVSEQVANGGEILIRLPDGNVEKVHVL